MTNSPMIEGERSAMLPPIRLLPNAAAIPSPRRRAWGRLLVAAFVVLPLSLALTTGEAWGCPTCKDGMVADDASVNMARGYFYSILLMLAMPFTLASCFGMYVWREYRRQERSGDSAAFLAELEAQQAARRRSLEAHLESAPTAAGSNAT